MLPFFNYMYFFHCILQLLMQYIAVGFYTSGRWQIYHQKSKIRTGEGILNFYSPDTVTLPFIPWTTMPYLTPVHYRIAEYHYLPPMSVGVLLSFHLHGKFIQGGKRGNLAPDVTVLLSVRIKLASQEMGMWCILPLKYSTYCKKSFQTSSVFMVKCE